jgi:FkbM family methyltransferase
METFDTKYGKVTLYNNEKFIITSFRSGNYWDIGNLQNLKKYIKGNVLEIGGHCGTSSIIYASFLEEGNKVYVYEPQKNLFNLLVKNIKDNNLEDKIIPTNSGIFCYTGQGVMNNIDLDGGGGIVKKRYNEESNLPCNFGGIGLGKDGEEINVTTVDDLNLSNIGFIHCDAQGSENFIFSKAKELIKKERPVILYENIDLYGTYLYDTICESYPDYKEESKFDVKKYCMEELNYSEYIDKFGGGIDTLLIP